MTQKVEQKNLNKGAVGPERDYIVKGTMTANVHAVVRARTINAARNKACKAETNWWFDDTHDDTGVTIIDIDIL